MLTKVHNRKYTSHSTFSRNSSAATNGKANSPTKMRQQNTQQPYRSRYFKKISTSVLGKRQKLPHIFAHRSLLIISLCLFVQQKSKCLSILTSNSAQCKSAILCVQKARQVSVTSSDHQIGVQSIVATRLRKPQSKVLFFVFCMQRTAVQCSTTQNVQITKFIKIHKDQTLRQL